MVLAFMFVTVDFICFGLVELWGKESENDKMEKNLAHSEIRSHYPILTTSRLLDVRAIHVCHGSDLTVSIYR